MKDLAPGVFRQRLLVEAKYSIDVTGQDVEGYLEGLPKALNLRIYSDPVVYSPGGEGKDVNQGYDGFVALIDSGISIYVWESAKFLSAVIYTCKGFDSAVALEFTRNFFQTTEMVHREF